MTFSQVVTIEKRSKHPRIPTYSNLIRGIRVFQWNTVEYAVGIRVFPNTDFLHLVPDLIIFLKTHSFFFANQLLNFLWIFKDPPKIIVPLNNDPHQFITKMYINDACAIRIEILCCSTSLINPWGGLDNLVSDFVHFDFMQQIQRFWKMRSRHI